VQISFQLLFNAEKTVCDWYGPSQSLIINCMGSILQISLPIYCIEARKMYIHLQPFPMLTNLLCVTSWSPLYASFLNFHLSVSGSWCVLAQVQIC